MGLDITAYRKLKQRDTVFNDHGEPIDPATRETLDHCVQFYVNPNFPGREEGVTNRAVYEFEDADDIISIGYMSYGHWREALAKLAGYPLTTVEGAFGPARVMHAGACWAGASGPFSELINFADNEGVIGPVVAAKLAQDFADFDERAKAVDEAFYARYAALKRGMEMAADGGALKFH